jgi:hypothetical protein
MKPLIISLLVLNFSFADTANDYLNSLKNEIKKENPSFKDFDINEGEKIFTSKHIGKKGKEISCTTCHSDNLQKSGENVFTGKIIEPLSQKVNKNRFTDIATIEKWLKRNFNDVYNREGSLVEKGNVMTYILSK